MIDITVDSSQYGPNADPHVDSYDCTGAVSLNSSMQSNVPSPFGGMHKFTHLNVSFYICTFANTQSLLDSQSLFNLLD